MIIGLDICEKLIADCDFKYDHDSVNSDINKSTRIYKSKLSTMIGEIVQATYGSSGSNENELRETDSVVASNTHQNGIEVKSLSNAYGKSHMNSSDSAESSQSWSSDEFSEDNDGRLLPDLLFPCQNEKSDDVSVPEESDNLNGENFQSPVSYSY